jgi:hypothetical protein
MNRRHTPLRRLTGLALAVLLAAAGTTAAAGPEAGTGTTPAAHTADVSLRTTRGFVCQRVQLDVLGRGETLVTRGTVTSKSLSCQNCCQEHQIFVNDFETGDTSGWSVSVGS